MTELLKQFFRRVTQKITPLQAALDELEEAQLDLLKTEAMAEYAANMVRYNEQRITRLKTRTGQL